MSDLSSQWVVIIGFDRVWNNRHEYNAQGNVDQNSEADGFPLFESLNTPRDTLRHGLSRQGSSIFRCWRLSRGIMKSQSDRVIVRVSRSTSMIGQSIHSSEWTVMARMLILVLIGRKPNVTINMYALFKRHGCTKCNQSRPYRCEAIHRSLVQRLLRSIPQCNELWMDPFAMASALSLLSSRCQPRWVELPFS